MRALRFERSAMGYGWHLWIGSRVRVASSRALTPMRPHVYKSGDEHCNDVLAFHLWPLGGLDVWWRWHQRTLRDGPCDECRPLYGESGMCWTCKARPCDCAPTAR